MEPRAADGSRTRRRTPAAAVTAAVVLAADQTAKTFALQRLQNGPIHLFGPLSLTLSFNSGVAFSLGVGLTVPIIVSVVVLVGALVWFAAAAPSYLAAIGTGLVLGGALGNLADRVFRSHHGAVVDFVHLGFWPTFNLADVAIVGGTVLLLASFWLRQGRKRPEGAGT